MSFLDRVYTEPLSMTRAQELARDGVEHREAMGIELRCSRCGLFALAATMRVCKHGHALCHHGETCPICETT